MVSWRRWCRSVVSSADLAASGVGSEASGKLGGGKATDGEDFLWVSDQGGAQPVDDLPKTRTVLEVCLPEHSLVLACMGQNSVRLSKPRFLFAYLGNIGGAEKDVLRARTTGPSAVASVQSIPRKRSRRRCM